MMVFMKRWKALQVKVVEMCFESSFSLLEQFKQEDMIDLIKDLNLSKEAAEILAFWLKKKSASEPEFQ